MGLAEYVPCERDEQISREAASPIMQIKVTNSEEYGFRFPIIYRDFRKFDLQLFN